MGWVEVRCLRWRDVKKNPRDKAEGDSMGTGEREG